MKRRAPKRPAHERRRLILEGAQAVFASASYAKSATADVAKAAGVSAPAVYRYFPSKKDLYVSSLKAAGEILLRIWERIVDEDADPLQTIWAIGMGYYDHVQSRSPVMRLWFQALGEAADTEVRAALAANFAAAVDLLEKNLERGRARGVVRRDIDLRIAAWHFMGIGLTFDLINVLGLHEELDRCKVEDWGRLYLESVKEKPDGAVES
jgi:AcrR family transcriptional regulator